MTKIVSPKTMSELEALAYQQGYKESEFMNNGGHGIAIATQEYIKEHQLPHRIWLLCGKGNNAGDAFVAGRFLLEKGFEVTAIQPEAMDHCTPLCQENGRLFLNKNGKLLNNIESFDLEGVILDGIFGTGFKGQVRPPYASLIETANQSGLPILAIDIPSGLNGTTGQIEGIAIKAAETIYLGLPKSGCFLQDGWEVTGKIRGVDFGLPAEIIEQAREDFNLITAKHAARLVPEIKRTRHKYEAGYVIGLAGSPTMPGAALLSSLAAFRGGSGIVRLLHPQGMEASLVSSPYELIKVPFDYENPEEISQIMQKAGATFIGPGLGRALKTQKLLKSLISVLKNPCVLDADALTLYPELNYTLPKQTIFTPHRGEMQTLLKSTSHLICNLELLKTCQAYAEEHQITLICKGAPTFIFQPQKPIFVNSKGDPGMATAGSGDVLTGLLASLLSQGLSCHDAAILGVYLHGLSGELAAIKRGTSIGMMAGDLIFHFSGAYNILEKIKKKLDFLRN